MKTRMADAGTKYFAISCWFREIFWLMMPSKHFCPASNTPDPEFVVAATSLITVENLNRVLGARNAGDMTCERTVSSGTATITGSPGHGWFSHNGIRRICKLIG